MIGKVNLNISLRITNSQAVLKLDITKRIDLFDTGKTKNLNTCMEINQIWDKN